MTTPSPTCDVAIVGLGPTGAMLANLLGQYGWSVIAIEREEDIYYAPKAVHFDDEVMRIFQFAGLAEGLAKVCEPFRDMAFLLKAGGPPALASQVGSVGAPYGWAGAWWFHQPTLERHLRAGLERFAAVRTLVGHSVSSVRQDSTGATVTVMDAGGGPVGLTLALALARQGVGSILADPGDIAPMDPPGHLAPFALDQVLTEPCISLRGGWRLFGFERFADGVTAHLTQVAGEGQQQVRAQFLIGCDGADSLVRNFLDIDVEDHLAVAFGRGRVILAGDAAHPMPTASPEGLALGVADALCLAGRLAEWAAGTGEAAPLHRYETERRVAARQVRSGACA